MKSRFLALTMILSCLATEALGQEPTTSRSQSEQESLADQKFFEGKAKARQQKWDEALLLFERSWQLKPSYDSAGNLGQVALRLGLYVKAATYLDRCLHLFPASGSKPQRAQIEALFRESANHVATVHFNAGSQPGQLVLDRTTEVGPANGPLGAVYVSPGTHVVQVRQGDQVIAEQSFLAVAGASQQVQINFTQDSDSKSLVTSEPGPVAAPSTSNHPKPFEVRADHGAGRSLLPIFVGVGISAASFIAAGVLLDSAKTHVDNAHVLQAALQTREPGYQACSDGTNTLTCNQLHDELLGADRRYNWSYAMLGLGGASLLATLTYAAWPLLSSRAADGAARARQVPVQFHAARGGATLICQAPF